MALRFDRGSYRKPERLSDGSLRVDAVLTRAGVFKYRKPDGSPTFEYRPRHEVFSKASLDSFVGVAVTDDHPWNEPDGLVTIESRERLAVGTVLSVRAEGDEVIGTLVITNPSTIAKLEAGDTAVSCGYEQDTIEQPGVAPSGERYDSIQTKIVGNHVAVAVHTARAGDIARVRMDSAVMIAGETGKGDTVMEELKKALADLATQMVKNGELQARLDAVTAEKTKLETSAKETQSRLDAVTAERDAAKEKAEKAEKARLDSEGSMMERARTRIKLEETAGRFVRNDAGEPEDLSKKSDAEIRAVLVEKLTGKSMEGKSEAYVSARLDAALETVTAGDDAMGAVRTVADDVRHDSGESSAEKVRAEWVKNQNDRFDNFGKKGK
jgi:hypothetical protein